METIQDIQFALMRRASFNDFDGDHVADALLENGDLWRGAFMTREEPVMTLRDIPKDQWNVDTLLLTAAPGGEEALEALAKAEFRADSVEWLDDREAAFHLGVRPASKQVLVCWWD